MGRHPKNPQKKYYVVWEGRKKGVLGSWEECKESVHGVKSARYKAFTNLAEARYAFEQDYSRYLKKFATPTDTIVRSFRYQHPSLDGLCVDASCRGNPGLLEYRGVDLGTNKEIFREGPMQGGTNNVGEFLALVQGLTLLKEQHDYRPIYSDSFTAMSWVKRRDVNTVLEPMPENRQIFKLITKSVNWLCSNHFENQIIKWQTNKWGEIPADFGRK